ncbi:glycoside hydrolase family 43 protein [Sphingobacterium corticibacterium]|uniref:Glycoside hydrolase family 43 protein n=1 Tax=Sphingobacterium corticibacterium TaxID=2484746 RepID=A0A4Q6XPM4_9SPHI|nr:glycoside hydrolase family 43 protein [Sphingobacterium corticibacterium]RZF59304.1 glycoside hydrolase family 43 protein [Sphingobacterium corticibacterium]
MQSKRRILNGRARILSCLLLTTLFVSCNSTNTDTEETDVREGSHEPLFQNFTYTGKDKIYEDNPLEEDFFYSPILQGCYPDPSITRKGDDYYLVASSFVMFPGVPIFHSKDLVNWKQIGHVLNRESQLKVETAGISAGIYAPDIMYNPHNDTFYMITTQIASGIGNMVVKTKDPLQGNWSDPIKLDFDGIDPALFFDDDGKAYVVHNDAPDEGKERYKGHRVIKVWDYDIEKDQVIAGTDKIIVDGGVDITQKPIWIEAPHIYKRNNQYYLMCAEGGTGGNHSEVIFVCDSPRGPYKPSSKNPILSQRHLDKRRANPVEWAGHADLVETPSGEWYGVFLAIRPNEKNRVNTGRETFILPVDWSGEWPVFEGGMEPLKPSVKMPTGAKNKMNTAGLFPNGNFTFADSFKERRLDDRWVALRGPRENFVREIKDGIIIKPFEVNIKKQQPISALFYRQQHQIFSAEVEMDYVPQGESDLAGITCLQSEQFNYVFGLTKSGDDYYVVLERTEKGHSKLVANAKVDQVHKLKLKVDANGDDYRFSYDIGRGDFENVGGTVSGDILSTDVAGGFTGAMIGLYATSANDIKID